MNPAAPIGIIGLGLMGQTFAHRLQLAGFTVTGWDVDASKQPSATTADEVFSKCERIILSLPNSIIVREVIDRAPLRSNQIIIDTSTGAPSDAVLLATKLRAQRVHYLEATISGSSDQLRRGEALTMIAGEAHAIDACTDLWEAFGNDFVDVGESGNASALKLVTNLVLGLNRAALAEGLTFARQMKLAPELALAVLRRSMGYSRIMDTKGEKMINADFTPQAKLAQHLKDVRLMLDSANTSLPLTEAHRDLLEKAVSLGLGELDNSAIIKAYDHPPA